MFNDLSILLRLPTVSKPQTENRRSTKACDAGANIMSCAISGVAE